VSDLTITPLEKSEWQLLKDLRIQALTESPDAFSPPVEEYLSQQDPYWIQAAQRIADSEDIAIFIVRRDNGAYGLVSSQRDAAGIGHIGAMWLDPVERGQGTGRQLLESACEFLLNNDCSSIKLSVTETNEAAINLYRSRGFIFTGESEPLRAGSPLKNLFMELHH